MAVKNIYPGFINQSVGKTSLVGRNVIAPIPAPMEGKQHDIARLFDGGHLIFDAEDRLVGEISQPIDAW